MSDPDMARRLRTFIVALLISPLFTRADVNVEITAHIINTTCEFSFDRGKYVNLGDLGVNDFDNSVTPEDLHGKGSPFYITVKDCAPVGGVNPTKMTIDFQPVSGSMSPYSKQIFANEDSNGAQNIGVVIFSTHDPNNIFNVMNIDGTPRSVYDVTPADYTNAHYSFYARMQKILSAQPITPGAVQSRVQVTIYYE
ncbi:fimbrial-like protein [Pseudocitrobacter cyperus]|uniref:Fimbrial-like protein n=1 Tax=Pseudocitrobacter cyperus TaxID=3112843 RepID=A0ABV0HI27_9ENTR